MEIVPNPMHESYRTESQFIVSGSLGVEMTEYFPYDWRIASNLSFRVHSCSPITVHQLLNVRRMLDRPHDVLDSSSRYKADCCVLSGPTWCEHFGFRASDMPHRDGGF